MRSEVENMLEKRFTTILILLLIMCSLVLAFDTLSVSQVNLVSNDPELNGQKVFLLTGVENGASDSVVYSINTIANQALQNTGEKLKKDGTIKSSLTKFEVQYPLYNEQLPIYRAYIEGTKTYIPFVDNDNWCWNLAGNNQAFWLKPEYSFTVYCVSFKSVAQLGKIQAYQISFNDEITVQLNDGSSAEKIILSETNTVGKTSHVIARYSGNLVSTTGIPTLSTDYEPIWDSTKNEWYIAKKTLTTSYRTFIRENPDISAYMQTCINTGSVENCVNTFNSYSTIPSTTITGYVSNIVYSGSSGRIVLTGTTLYQYPVFNMKISADWLGIYLPVGKPVFQGTPTSQCFAEGASGKIDYSIKNDAEVQASFNIGIICDGGFNAIPLGLQKFNAYETRSLTTYITSQTTSRTNGICTITATDASNPSVQATSTVNVCVIEANQCENIGEQRCYDMIIQKCSSVNGVNVWQLVGTCNNGCEYDNGVPKCKPDINNPCGNGICNTGETKITCPVDCDKEEECEPTWKIGNWIMIPSFKYKEASFWDKLKSFDFSKTQQACFTNWTAVAFFLGLIAMLLVTLFANQIFKKEGLIKNKMIRGIFSLLLGIVIYTMFLNLFWIAVIITIIFFLVRAVL